MKQKLALCCALIHRPTVLFLDEPTTGVDAVSRKEFWEMLKRLKTQGITILVSTPYMEEAMLCDRIALIQGGNIMSVDTPDNITTQYPGPLFAIRSTNLSGLLGALRTNELISSCFAFGEYHHVTFHKPTKESITTLTEQLTDKKFENLELKPIQPTIEDCFIQLMNNK